MSVIYRFFMLFFVLLGLGQAKVVQAAAVKTDIHYTTERAVYVLSENQQQVAVMLPYTIDSGEDEDWQLTEVQSSATEQIKIRKSGRLIQLIFPVSDFEDEKLQVTLKNQLSQGSQAVTKNATITLKRPSLNQLVRDQQSRVETGKPYFLWLTVKYRSDTQRTSSAGDVLLNDELEPDDVDGVEAFLWITEFGQTYTLTHKNIPMETNIPVDTLNDNRLVTSISKFYPYRFEVSETGVPKVEKPVFAVKYLPLIDSSTGFYEYNDFATGELKYGYRTDYEDYTYEELTAGEDYEFDPIFDEEAYPGVAYLGIEIEGTENTPGLSHELRGMVTSSAKKVDSITGESLSGGQFALIEQYNRSFQYGLETFGLTKIEYQVPYYFPSSERSGTAFDTIFALENPQTGGLDAIEIMPVADKNITKAIPYAGIESAYPAFVSGKYVVEASPYSYPLGSEGIISYLLSLGPLHDFDYTTSFYCVRQVPELNYGLVRMSVTVPEMLSSGTDLSALATERTIKWREQIEEFYDKKVLWIQDRTPVKDNIAMMIEPASGESYLYQQPVAVPWSWSYKRISDPFTEYFSMNWLQEIVPPKGYKLADELFPFPGIPELLYDDEVTQDAFKKLGIEFAGSYDYEYWGKTYKVPYYALKNDPDYFEIELTKVDQNDEPLKGAEFTLSRTLTYEGSANAKEDKQIDPTTGGSWETVDPTPHTGGESGTVFDWKKLMKADANYNDGEGREYLFKIEETKVPGGYGKASDTYFYFDYSKIDYNGANIPNSEKVPDIVVIRDGMTLVEGTDYLWDQEKGQFTFDVINIYDRDLVLRKIDEINHDPLGGAVFVLQYQDEKGDWHTVQVDGKDKRYITSSAEGTPDHGTFKLEGTELSNLYEQYGRGGAAKWRFKEIQAPEDYELPEDEADLYTDEFQIVADGILNQAGEKINELIKTNYREITSYELAFRKTDADGNLLDGAEFELIADDESIASVTSTGTGGSFSFKDLQVNVTYTLKETTPPPGYGSLDADYRFVLKDDGSGDQQLEVYYGDKLLVEGTDYEWDNDELILSFTIKNYPITMPVTGGIGIIGFLIAGAVLLGVAYNVNNGKLQLKSLKKKSKNKRK